jgi:sulfite reductase beta subunit-like hemoprotein
MAPKTVEQLKKDYLAAKAHADQIYWNLRAVVTDHAIDALEAEMDSLDPQGRRPEPAKAKTVKTKASGDDGQTYSEPEAFEAPPLAKAPFHTRAAKPPKELTKWVADKKARRVPTFVIESTRLDTKKAIQARYGEDAVFEVGKPLPPVMNGAQARA